MSIELLLGACGCIVISYFVGYKDGRLSALKDTPSDEVPHSEQDRRMIGKRLHHYHSSFQHDETGIRFVKSGAITYFVDENDVVTSAKFHNVYYIGSTFYGTLGAGCYELNDSGEIVRYTTLPLSDYEPINN